METNHKILVIRMSSLGDIILTAPVLRNLKKHWPGAEISMLVKPQFAAAVRKIPFVSGTIPFDGVLSTLRIIKNGRYDILIDLHSNLRSRLISLLSGIPLKVRYAKDSLARRLFVSFRVPSPALEKHTLERYLDVLSKIGVPAVFREPLMGDWTPADGEEGSIKSGKKKICLVQTAFLGDSVLTLPLLEKMKKSMPDSEITVVTRPDTVSVFASSGLAAEVIADNKRTAGSFLGEFLRLVNELKKRKFDAAIVPHRSLRSALLVRLAGIPLRIGFGASAGSFLFTHQVPFSWLMHDLERNLTLLLPLIRGPVEVGAGFPPLKDNAGALVDLGLTGEVFIGANPGSVWPTKRWPAANWALLIKRLAAAYGTRVLLVGGRGEMRWNSEIEAAAGKDACLNLTGRTGVDELMSAIRKMKIFITNDSGPMHIAVAFGVPVAAIFGPTTRELGFFPYGEKNMVIEEPLDCRPCALHGSISCPRGHFLCMRLITPDKVFDAVSNILDRSGIVPREKR